MAKAPGKIVNSHYNRFQTIIKRRKLIQFRIYEIWRHAYHKFLQLLLPALRFEIMSHSAELHHENLLQISNGTSCFWKAVVFFCSWEFLKIHVQLNRFIMKTYQICDVVGSRSVISCMEWLSLLRFPLGPQLDGSPLSHFVGWLFQDSQ